MAVQTAGCAAGGQAGRPASSLLSAGWEEGSVHAPDASAWGVLGAGRWAGGLVRPGGRRVLGSWWSAAPGPGPGSPGLPPRSLGLQRGLRERGDDPGPPPAARGGAAGADVRAAAHDPVRLPAQPGPRGPPQGAPLQLLRPGSAPPAAPPSPPPSPHSPAPHRGPRGPPAGLAASAPLQGQGAVTAAAAAFRTGSCATRLVPAAVGPGSVPPPPAPPHTTGPRPQPPGPHSRPRAGMPGNTAAGPPPPRPSLPAWPSQAAAPDTTGQAPPGWPPGRARRGERHPDIGRLGGQRDRVRALGRSPGAEGGRRCPSAPAAPLLPATFSVAASLPVDSGGLASCISAFSESFMSRETLK